ncbi:hypothetical protein TTHERM_00414400 (macronuclear) [Tetrahymena thermophila SB210]|uniref:Uncharacterized protein n=1 Tax=Tetrahymena thermophila (strain SB210) TaxID=312017 RepID=Q22P51_TETTS|nr:hypothetical protein TTHERM_00414400 [Tetrahymena thermophila SB210]EAR86960.1 hypothetical protein TTHERM_00414400 [Tetrahymena thermophila SB210]|eukprot:XP_001007205.1 hypothetical protein TTHERM_00414400 [Tetrahymena thermophila SB210]
MNLKLKNKFTYYQGHDRAYIPNDCYLALDRVKAERNKESSLEILQNGTKKNGILISKLSKRILQIYVFQNSYIRIRGFKFFQRFIINYDKKQVEMIEQQAQN